MDKSAKLVKIKVELEAKLMTIFKFSKNFWKQ